MKVTKQKIAAVSYTSSPKPRKTQPKSKRQCYYCEGSFHPRNLCPARERSCHNCGKQGHYAKVCRSSQSQTASKVSSSLTSTSDAQDERYLVTVSKSSFAAGAPNCLQRTVVDATISGHSVKALLDTGASENFKTSLWWNNWEFSMSKTIIVSQWLLHSFIFEHKGNCI